MFVDFVQEDIEEIDKILRLVDLRDKVNDIITTMPDLGCCDEDISPQGMAFPYRTFLT